MPSINSHGSAYDKFPDSPEAYREAAWNGTLQRLFSVAVIHAEDRIAWYDHKAAERAKVAKRIRWWSLFLFALGTLAPVLVTFILKAAAVAGVGGTAKEKWSLIDWMAAVPLVEVGYVLLALAGALVIFDQFFDVSGSWIRFRQSQARLEVLLADFRFSWAELMTKDGGIFADRTKAVEFVMLLRTFVSSVELLAEEETKEWARRFNAQIAAFDRNPNLKIRLDSKNGADGTNADTTDINKSSKAGPSGSGTSPAANAANDSGTLPSQVTVKVRLAVDDAETLDRGSLQLAVNEALVEIGSDGLIELPLEVGHAHHLTATGRRNGQSLRGEIAITPTINDEGKPHTINLA
jgi:hypothetical protein